MCGIAGFLDTAGNPAQAELALRMAQRLVHRGPDDMGVWAEGAVALAHRRLSILDLSPAGHQPMQSACGRYVVAFNGELYNFRDIRDEIQGDPYFGAVVRRWRGHSDTEVMLAAIGRWGLVETLKRLVGMFAIALWDRRERALFLARDRMGEKPLYYARFGSTVLFGSELKALRAHPVWSSDVDRNALALLMRHNYIPAPYSIYRGVRKLPPATFLRIVPGARDVATPQRYWSLATVAEAGGQFDGSESEAVDGLEAVLARAIGEQMVADVPLGAFLSGGIDSSTVVALMQSQSRRPVRTFSIGFHEEGYNEAQHAKMVARHLGTEHVEVYVTPEEAREVIPSLPMLYDEPFSDSSQIPTFLVSKLARREVTVSLSGDGGDELFGGYPRYFRATELADEMGRARGIARMATAYVNRMLPLQRRSQLLALVRAVMPKHLRNGGIGGKVHKLAGILDAGDPEAIYRELVSHWNEPEELVVGAREPVTVLTDRGAQPDLKTFLERMMYLDAVSYLPDDILVKLDRAAMGVSLEARVPMLDHRVVEFAWSLPLAFKVRDGQGKCLLRELLYRHVPKVLVERPKMGFGVPIDAWLRGPLRQWAEDLLAEERLRREGYLDPAPIRHRWAEHLSGQQNWQYPLWDVLMFQAWLQRNACA